MRYLIEAIHNVSGLLVGYCDLEGKTKLPEERMNNVQSNAVSMALYSYRSRLDI